MAHDATSAGSGQPWRSGRRFRRIARNCALAIVLVLGTGAVAARYGEAKDFERYASKETFASVGSSQIRYRLLGREHDAPPVVFLTGMIGSVEQWEAVQPAVAAFAPSLAYDRGGSGFSSGSSAHDARGQGDELAGLLASLGLNRPAIVVGYSASGSVARLFAAQHPEQVSALVLIEPYMPELDVRLPQRPGRWRTYARTLGTCTFLSLFGVRRLANEFGFMKFQPVPQTDVDYRAQAVLQRFSHWWAFDRELWSQSTTDHDVLTVGESRPLLVFSTESGGEDESDRTLPLVLHDYVGAHHGLLKNLGTVNHSLVVFDPQAVAQIVEGIRGLAGQSRRD